MVRIHHFKWNRIIPDGLHGYWRNSIRLSSRLSVRTQEYSPGTHQPTKINKWSQKLNISLLHVPNWKNFVYYSCSYFTFINRQDRVWKSGKRVFVYITNIHISVFQIPDDRAHTYIYHTNYIYPIHTRWNFMDPINHKMYVVHYIKCMVLWVVTFTYESFNDFTISTRC